MRTFSSYGPVNSKKHFCVQRKNLIENCVQSLIGDSDDLGHYFTIWAPRQTGKTWLIEQAVKKINADYPNDFLVIYISMQAYISDKEDLEKNFIQFFCEMLEEELMLEIPPPKSWQELRQLFTKQKGIFDRHLIILIDEFDKLPPQIIDFMVSLFREMYLKRNNYNLHGLALVGVRSVLGVDSDRGSPFNIQRSLHVENLTLDEVREMYNQYKQESGQKIDSDIVDKIYYITNGQPGLVSWFGELLTEKYNPDLTKTIDLNHWIGVYRRAKNIEPNNTMLNIISKARKKKNLNFLAALYANESIPFHFHSPQHSFLYQHGIIAPKMILDNNNLPLEICRFSSHFIQDCLYDVIRHELIDLPTNEYYLDPLDDLTDVLDGPDFDIPALIDRYQSYLNRLKEKGLSILEQQPLRTDLRPREAIGHFHFYAWLIGVIGDDCIITPEFPTGNGQVDIHIQCKDRRGIIEIKSFKNMRALKRAKKQSQMYAKNLNYSAVSLLVFISNESIELIDKISSQDKIEGIVVTTKAVSI
ncbi:ATPase domain protein, prokaryote domain protein [Candidatus Magnetomorum sp. HK-1]|nr:ATPase domain protein, prokaryote domain protein [Candidatus Magnetomorum sp. HK-1]